MVHGSGEPGRVPRAVAPPPPTPPWPPARGGPGALARLPWAMSHEPLIINTRLISVLFLLFRKNVLRIKYYPRTAIPTPAPAAPLGDTQHEFAYAHSKTAVS